MKTHRLWATIALGLSMVLAGCTPSTGQQLPVESDPAEVMAVDLAADRVVYLVTQRMDVVNRGDGYPAKHNLWIALIQDVEPYQDVLQTVISPADYRVITDEYGNRYAEMDLADIAPGETVSIELRYRLAVYRFATDLGNCQGRLPEFFTQAELHVESNNPQIRELAEILSRSQVTACEQVQAFYEYVADTLYYTYNGQDWGAQAALGEMGADCTEYASLTMALCRAAGIPARYLEGLYYTPGGDPTQARTEHAWLEAYLPGVGWVPLDPTLGRSQPTRADYFAAIPPNHIIVTRGRSPSTLRGASYWTHLYWPGDSTEIEIENFSWDIRPVPE